MSCYQPKWQTMELQPEHIGSFLQPKWRSLIGCCKPWTSLQSHRFYTSSHSCRVPKVRQRSQLITHLEQHGTSVDLVVVQFGETVIHLSCGESPVSFLTGWALLTLSPYHADTASALQLSRGILCAWDVPSPPASLLRLPSHPQFMPLPEQYQVSAGSAALGFPSHPAHNSRALLVPSILVHCEIEAAYDQSCFVELSHPPPCSVCPRTSSSPP